MPILKNLPTEIILQIAQFLTPKHQYAFARVNRRCWRLFEQDMTHHRFMDGKWHSIRIGEDEPQNDGEFPHFEDFFHTLLFNPKMAAYIQELTMSWLYFHHCRNETSQSDPYQGFWDASPGISPDINTDEAESIATLVNSNPYIPKEVSLTVRSELDTLSGSIRLGCLDALEAQTMSMLPQLKYLSIRPHPEQAFVAGFFEKLAREYAYRCYRSIDSTDLPLNNVRELKIIFDVAHNNDGLWLQWVLHLPALDDLFVEGLQDDTTISVGHLEKLPNIKTLRVVNFRIQALLVAELISCLALDELWLKHCTFDGINDDCSYRPQQWIKSLRARSKTTLKTLLLSEVSINADGASDGYSRGGNLTSQRGPISMLDFSSLQMLCCQWKDVVPDEWQHFRLCAVLHGSIQRLKFERVSLNQIRLVQDMVRFDLDELPVLDHIVLELDDESCKVTDQGMSSVNLSGGVSEQPSTKHNFDLRLADFKTMFDMLGFDCQIYSSHDMHSDEQQDNDNDDDDVPIARWCLISIAKRGIQESYSWPVY